MLHKRDGFNNQIAISIPEFIQEELKNHPLTNLLYLTDAGYYPKALFHFRERPKGCGQSILIYCTDGNGWVEVPGIRKKISKNTFFIIPANMPHKYGAEESNPWSIYWMHFTGNQSLFFTNNIFVTSDMSNPENTVNERRTGLFEELFQTLSMGFSKENLEYVSVCIWYLLGSFHFLPQFNRLRSVQQTDVVEKSILFMNEHLHQNLKLTEIAEHCGFSVSHFSSVFRKTTSRSPIEYYLGLKMQRACQMLDFTGKRVKEIATDLAFDDQFYFSRLFKKMVGTSPLEYRRKKKG